MYRYFFKRLFDILFSLLGLPFFILLYIPIALLINIEDRGPVFYMGKRLGKNGKIFKMYKFRSMKVNAPDIRLADGSTYNGEKDDRVTKIGRFLRKTSLDEMPQLLNILFGQMSFIGPRPDLPEHKMLYTKEEEKKLKVLPGVTGYNQAYVRNAAKWKDRLANDVYYVDHITLFMDIKILFKTFLTIIKRENVYIAEENNPKNAEDKKVDDQQN